MGRCKIAMVGKRRVGYAGELNTRWGFGVTGTLVTGTAVDDKGTNCVVGLGAWDEALTQGQQGIVICTSCVCLHPITRNESMSFCICIT